MLFGLQGIGKMANWAGPIMLVYFVWLVIWLAHPAEFKANIPSLWVSKVGYWSLPFMIYLAVQTNWWATVALNMSDISRGINPAKKGAFGVGLFVGVVGCQMLGTALGFTGGRAHRHDPAAGNHREARPGDHARAHRPRVRVPRAVVHGHDGQLDPAVQHPDEQLQAALEARCHRGNAHCVLRDPVVAVTKGQGIVDLATSYAGNYGILLGPIAGLMIANYWVVHKQKINMQDLYTKGSGTYWYSNGWSISAFVSLVLTWVLCYVTAIILPPLMAYITIGKVKIPFPGGVIWYFSVVYAFVLEIIFSKVFREAKPA